MSNISKSDLETLALIAQSKGEELVKSNVSEGDFELVKGFGKKDISKLVPKQIVDKTGRRTTVYVKNGEEPDSKGKKTSREEKKSAKAEYNKYQKQIFDLLDSGEKTTSPKVKELVKKRDEWADKAGVVKIGSGYKPPAPSKSGT